ncbi:hypothetical protein [Streptomyces sp. NPDC058045]|uniref:hypothetical protein n=1 Tax=Streptomyces sp. NPDC058045 TaxID=3346311 RepID=UPI0036EE9371
MNTGQSAPRVRVPPAREVPLGGPRATTVRHTLPQRERHGTSGEAPAGAGAATASALHGQPELRWLHAVLGVIVAGVVWYRPQRASGGRPAPRRNRVHGP